MGSRNTILVSAEKGGHSMVQGREGCNWVLESKWVVFQVHPCRIPANYNRFTFRMPSPILTPHFLIYYKALQQDFQRCFNSKPAKVSKNEVAFPWRRSAKEDGPTGRSDQ